MSIRSTEFVNVSYPYNSKRIVHVELARNPVNAFNEQFWKEFGKVFDAIDRDGDVRVVVLSSSLPTLFTAGLDVSDAIKLISKTDDPGRHALALRDHVLRFQHAISSVERCRYPVIAAVHGLCIGLGIDIISACDIRYAASSAAFSIKEVDVGLASDIGTLARLPKISSNESLLRELAYTAREFSSLEALSLGLVSRVIEGGQRDVVGAAIKLAEEIAKKSPVAVTGTKRLLLHSRDNTVADNLEYSANWNAFALQSQDTAKAIEAFKSRKAPDFKALPKLGSKL